MFGPMLEPEEKQLSPYFGMPVLVLMKDGSRKFGQLTSCSSGRLVLNGDAIEPEAATMSRKAGTRRSARKRIRKPREENADPLTLPPLAPTPFGQPPFEQPREGWDGLSLAPLRPEPPFPVVTRESVPLKAVESIMVL